MSFNLVIKVGNQVGPMGLKDGMPVCILPSHEVLSERMKMVYAIVTLPDSLHELALEACEPLYIDDIEARIRSKFIDLTSLSITIGDPALEEKWRAAGIVVPVQNGAGMDDSIFRDSEGHEWPDVPDANAISSGSFTVGSGGDYSNWAAAFGDVAANLTGDLDLTQISPTSEAGVTLTVNLQGYDFTCLSTNPPKGDPTSGWTSDISIAGSLVLDIQGSAGVGNFEVKDFRMERSGSTTDMYKVTSYGPNISIHDCMFRAGLTSSIVLSVLSTSGATSSTHIDVWNIVAYGSDSGYGIGITIGASYSAVSTLENCTVYDIGSYGIDLLATPVTCRDNSVTDVGGVDWRYISSATGYNNASEDGSAADGNWSTGSGNLPSITAAAAYVSVSESSPDFLKVKTGGPIESAGITPAIAANVKGVRGGPRPHAGLVSIGADEFLTVNPGIKGKQIQLDTSSFTGSLGKTDNTVQAALITLDEKAGGITSTLNKNMSANATSSDGDLAVDQPLQATPRGDIQVLVNGIAVELGDGVKTTFCYFSGDGGTTARAKSAIVVGDELYWNGSIANYELDANDLIDFVYEA